MQMRLKSAGCSAAYWVMSALAVLMPLSVHPELGLKFLERQCSGLFDRTPR